MAQQPSAQCGDHVGGPAPILFDLDGTVIDTELIPMIGDVCGLGEALRDLTRRTICGEVPFAESFLRRVELLKHIPISTIQAIVATAPLNPAIAAFIRDNRSRCFIVTGNCDLWILPIVEELDIPVFSSQGRCDGDTLLGVEQILDKGRVAAGFSGDFVAVGDGQNDLPMFLSARHAIAYGGVHPPAVSLLDVATHAVFDGTSLCRILQQL